MRKRLFGWWQWSWWCSSGRVDVVGVTVMLLVGFSFTKEVSDSVPVSAKYKEVVSVSGSVGQIPCPVTSFDEVVMILWYKGSSGAPIYSYDARNENIEPRHLTLKDEWGLRLYFRVWPNNRRYPALMIQELKPKDGGLYRCRVDYRNSPTSNSVTRLKIIEPPTRLEVRDTSPSRPISDQQMNMSGSNKHSDPSVTHMGPYSEGQNVTLVCSAYGGKPLPEVRWYKNGDMVDTSYTLSGTEYAINEMTINNLGRNHTHDIYSCQANNNNETQALSHKVHLEIYLGVTTVELEIPSPMIAGSEYSITCKTMGAYPTVKVEFWKNVKRIAYRSQMGTWHFKEKNIYFQVKIKMKGYVRVVHETVNLNAFQNHNSSQLFYTESRQLFFNKSMADNMTITSILYKPEVGDDGIIIICKAENPWVSKKPTVARKTMKIKYSPVTVLRLGRNRTTAFSEGESVLMECHVKANPPAHTIMWFHQGRQLGVNETSTSIRINGMTLFISYLTHQIGGDYNCEAVNDVGKGISNTLAIELHLSPKCVTSETTQVALGIGETQWLTCNILAWPSDLNFYWTLNRSLVNGETKNLSEHYRLPILSVGEVAPGINNVTVHGKSNLKQAEQQGDSSKQLSSGGDGRLSSSGSTFESLDYPEDQHMRTDDDDQTPKKNAMTDNTERESTSSHLLTSRTSLNVFLPEKRSSQKDISVGKMDGKPILQNITNNAKCTACSDASLSPRLPSSDASSSPSNQRGFPNFQGTEITTSDLVRKGKRHVAYSASTSTPVGDDGKSGGGLGSHRFQDRIRHKSLISYQVMSDKDYGTVACWATNSFGSQVFPCLFNIVKKERNSTKEKSTAKGSSGGATSPDKKYIATSRNLTGWWSSSQVEKKMEQVQGSPSSHGGFSKLQKTLGIVLLFILIFIAALTGLAFGVLFVLAKRKRREVQRIGPRSNTKTTNKGGPTVAHDDNDGAVNSEEKDTNLQADNILFTSCMGVPGSDRKPQLSYISSGTTTFSGKATSPENNKEESESLANNRTSRGSIVLTPKAIELFAGNLAHEEIIGQQMPGGTTNDIQEGAKLEGKEKYCSQRDKRSFLEELYMNEHK